MAPRLLVVGGGPAGVVAAVEGELAGFNVTLIEEESRLGGQYFRGRDQDRSWGSTTWFRDNSRDVAIALNTGVVDVDGGDLITWSQEHGGSRLGFECLILATGAHDRAVPMPGWTLPGAVTAGAALTFAKAYHVAIGRRVVVAGSGPFLLPVALALSRLGSTVTVIEATPFATSVGGLGTLVRDAPTLRQAVAYRLELAARGVKFLYGRVVTGMDGEDSVERVTHEAIDLEWKPVVGTAKTESVDAVALGYGFTPRVELAHLLSCDIRYDDVAQCFRVAINSRQKTSLANVWAAGEVTGVGGSVVARLEGALAALDAAEEFELPNRTARVKRTDQVQRLLEKAKRTQEWIINAFRIRDGLWTLASTEDLVCRCEEVTLGQLDAAARANSVSPRAIKSVTRAAMGLCQGTICRPLITELLRTRHGYRISNAGYPWSIRPPIRPVPFADWPVVGPPQNL